MKIKWRFYWHFTPQSHAFYLYTYIYCGRHAGLLKISIWVVHQSFVNNDCLAALKHTLIQNIMFYDKIQLNPCSSLHQYPTENKDIDTRVVWIGDVVEGKRKWKYLWVPGDHLTSRKRRNDECCWSGFGWVMRFHWSSLNCVWTLYFETNNWNVFMGMDEQEEIMHCSYLTQKKGFMLGLIWFVERFIILCLFSHEQHPQRQFLCVEVRSSVYLEWVPMPKNVGHEWR